jgi:putative spermidine/putrescine transport system ATP-binding protein
VADDAGRTVVTGGVVAVSESSFAAAGLVGVAVRLTAVRKLFGDVVAVDGVNLDIRDGEFFSLLGPSGSGKTTMLRMIAGFELPTSGTILLHGADVTTTAPFDRDVNTVFQDYALFPHMTVERNVAYGPMVRKVPRAERRMRVEEALAAVRLEGFGRRKPSQLSGGQRQRVALARALVNRPRVLLLDEPLGALDLKLREEMQVELKAIQRDVGITFIFVTHDQEEALTMSDRIAVFDHGRIEQVGTPTEVYERPSSLFVAGFVGTSNIMSGDVATKLLGRSGTFAVRPEKLSLIGPYETHARLGALGVVRAVQYVGADTRVRVALDAGVEVTVVRQNTDEGVTLEPGARVQVAWSADHVYEISQSTEA